MEHAGILLQKESQKRKNIKMRTQNKNHLRGTGAGIRAGMPLRSDCSGMGSVAGGIMCVKGNTHGETDTY